MILNKTLYHGGKYQYRIHQKKLENLCGNGFENLKKYIAQSFEKIPDEYFFKGPRSSILKFSVLQEKLSRVEHEVAILARMGLESNYYQDAHSNVQMFMLSYDEKTIAMEVPIWLYPKELDEYKKIFKEEQPLTGHIDILRIEDDKIWVWDFKPNAHREKYATTQTYFYAYMLSKRTGIAIENFMCGYFDDKNTYIFDPSKIKIQDAIKNPSLIPQNSNLCAHTTL